MFVQQTGSILLGPQDIVAQTSHRSVDIRRPVSLHVRCFISREDVAANLHRWCIFRSATKHENKIDEMSQLVIYGDVEYKAIGGTQ